MRSLRQKEENNTKFESAPNDINSNCIRTSSNHLLVLIIVCIGFAIWLYTVLLSLFAGKEIIKIIKSDTPSYIYHFIDTTNDNQKQLLNAILERTDVNVEQLVSSSMPFGHKYKALISINAPSLSNIIIKDSPLLFSHENINYVQKKIAAQGEEEYINDLLARLTSDVLCSNTFFSGEIEVELEKINGEWILINGENIENLVLGDIYTYQNNDVSFLTLKDLILPQTKVLTPEEVDISNIIETPVLSSTTFSSPDFLIKRGDTATFQGNLLLPDGDKSAVKLNLAIIDVNMNPSELKISIKAESDKSILLSPQMFEINCGGEVIKTDSNDLIPVSPEKSEYTILFKSDKSPDYIIFNSSLYFA